VKEIAFILNVDTTFSNEIKLHLSKVNCAQISHNFIKSKSWKYFHV